MADDYDAADLADRLAQTLRDRFKGNKRNAYQVAGVSPQTFDRALEGLTIRDDSRYKIEDMLTPVGYVSAPGQADPNAVTEEEVLAAIATARELMDAYERGQKRRRP